MSREEEYNPTIGGYGDGSVERPYRPIGGTDFDTATITAYGIARIRPDRQCIFDFNWNRFHVNAADRVVTYSGIVPGWERMTELSNSRGQEYAERATRRLSRLRR